eukprot:TRINITY_DN124464_c0_g1_i1.p1 TRINITY_DN124464_c0_g1~~TRINITY_DN124464_c0_g1_i1.p1  ORF type:complete len:311 (+),score=82.09 TRINITY_DN124464_c0_g1_i1:244-1176(+)
MSSLRPIQCVFYAVLSSRGCAWTLFGSGAGELPSSASVADGLSQRQQQLGQLLEREERQQAFLQGELSKLQTDLDQARREYSIESAAASAAGLAAGREAAAALPVVAPDSALLSPASARQQASSLLQASSPVSLPAQLPTLQQSPMQADVLLQAALTQGAAAQYPQTQGITAQQQLQSSPMTGGPIGQADYAALAARSVGSSMGLLETSLPNRPLQDAATLGPLALPELPGQQRLPRSEMPRSSADGFAASSQLMRAPAASAAAERQTQVTLPADTAAGNVYSFLSPDGRKHAFQVPAGVMPGSTVSVGW